MYIFWPRKGIPFGMIVVNGAKYGVVCVCVCWRDRSAQPNLRPHRHSCGTPELLCLFAAPTFDVRQLVAREGEFKWRLSGHKTWQCYLLYGSFSTFTVVNSGIFVMFRGRYYSLTYQYWNPGEWVFLNLGINKTISKEKGNNLELLQCSIFLYYQPNK